MKKASPLVAPLAALALPGAAQSVQPSTTTTPIKHVIVIFDENVSFDHYFGTYPNAANPIGEPKFVPAAGTPSVDGLTSALLTNNPNLANPFRLDRADIFTCDQLHDYALEQKAFDGGKMDQCRCGSTRNYSRSATPSTEPPSDRPHLVR